MPDVRVVTSGEWKDPNAMLCALGPERFAAAFRARLAAAEDIEKCKVKNEKSEGGHEQENGASDEALLYDPRVVAEAFLLSPPVPPRFGSPAKDEGAEGKTPGRRMLFYRGSFYQFDGRCYAELPDDDLRAQLVEFVQGREWLVTKGKETYARLTTPTGRFIGDVRVNLMGPCLVPSAVELPRWRDGRDGTRFVVLANGVLDVDGAFRLLVGEPPNNEKCKVKNEKGKAEAEAEEAAGGGLNRMLGALGRHSPDLFSVNAQPFGFEPEAECRRWHGFLDRVLPDAELQGIVQEWFGYCLLPTQAYQRILILQGDGANGKSVLLGVLRRLVGVRNCSAVPLEMLHMPHGLEPMVGRLLNVAGEWGHIDAAGLNVLKAVSGGDAVTINPKNRAAYQAVLQTRFTVTTNEPPRISDHSDAIWRRLMIVPFRVRIPEAERRPLSAFVDELCGELAGIFMWALEGLWRLMDRGGFAECDATLAMKAEYREESNPAAVWCDENLLVAGDEHEMTAAAEVYEAYATWCKTSGHRALSDSRFGREVARWWRKAGSGELRKSKRREQVGGRRLPMYVGLVLAEQPVKSEERRWWR